MSDNVIRIMCPKCLKISDYEYPNDMIFVKKDDFTTDLLNQGCTKGYQQGRAGELDKIAKMILLGCDEMSCNECNYRAYSKEVCQQAFTIEMLKSYIIAREAADDDDLK